MVSVIAILVLKIITIQKNILRQIKAYSIWTNFGDKLSAASHSDFAVVMLG